MGYRVGSGLSSGVRVLNYTTRRSPTQEHKRGSFSYAVKEGLSIKAKVLHKAKVTSKKMAIFLCINTLNCFLHMELN